MFEQIFGSRASNCFVGEIKTVFDESVLFCRISSMGNKKMNMGISIEFGSKCMNNSNDSRDVFLFLL
jgi:hypothetical protein